ncbi:unnamed protein product [Urochloa humidicola]
MLVCGDVLSSAPAVFGIAIVVQDAWAVVVLWVDTLPLLLGSGGCFAAMVDLLGGCFATIVLGVDALPPLLGRHGRVCCCLVDALLLPDGSSVSADALPSWCADWWMLCHRSWVPGIYGDVITFCMFSWLTA